jgi:hypothetical protein
MQLHWSGSTRYHNWFDKNRTIPRKMISLAQQSGLIGLVDWISVGPEDTHKNIEHSQDALERLLDHRPKRGGIYRIAAGGSEPLLWQMTMGLFPYRKSLSQVQGYNILNLWFDSQHFEGPGNSDNLVRIFRAIHTPEDTEFGFIHPYPRWSELTDTLSGPYGKPVTLGPMFSGVFWVNFLGSAHLNYFDRSRLCDLNTYQVEWVDDKALFFRVSQDIKDAMTPMVERDMFRITEIFRTAMR